MIKVYDLSGNVKGQIELPKVFSEAYRPDLIKRAVLVIWSNNRQPYGTDVLGGKRTSAHYHGMRHLDSSQRMMGREMARLPRVHRSSPGQNFRARFTPQAVGGREAHPPKVEKVWSQKINKKERRLAIRSAIAATTMKDLVKSRGHVFDIDLPIILTDDFESVKKANELKNILKALKLTAEFERAKEKKIRSGKGKMRGRKYKRKRSILFVVADDKGIIKAARNLPGAEACLVQNLNTELLAPGAQPARLVVWSESAVKKLNNLFK